MSDAKNKLELFGASVVVLAAIIGLYQACEPSDTPQTTPTITEELNPPQSDSAEPNADAGTPRATQGDVTLANGEHVDFETGQHGTGIANHDLTFTYDESSFSQYLIPSSASIVETGSGVDAAKCTERLEKDSDSKNMTHAGEAYCLRTSEGNTASVQVTKINPYPDHGPITLHFIVWEQ